MYLPNLLRAGQWRWATPTFVSAVALLAVPAMADRTNININVGVQIETRGPVHEAFAEPVVYDPDPGLVVPREPPPAIDEDPPDERPEGDAVTWIPGYWSWDDDRDDFLWVSGVWRSMPPGRQFVPGYWARTGRGAQWVAGSWISTTSQTLEYLPEPPPPQTLEPVGVAPAPDYTWVPGMWRWRNEVYVWRQGYWIPPQVDWVWVPGHYVWTPSGYLYVSGYWDYAVTRRGVLFAPAYIERAVYTRPAFVYRPTVVIQAEVLTDCLFVRARQRHYYFGDYFAVQYERAGIVPVYAFQRAHHGFSPLYAHALAVHVRRDPGWERGLIRQYELRRERPESRPPRTWVAFDKARGGGGPDRDRPGRNDNRPRGDDRAKAYSFARPLTELTSARDSRDSNMRFQKVDSQQRDGFNRGRTQLRDFQAQRRQLEQTWAEKSPLRSSRPETPSRGADQPRTVQPRGRTTEPPRADGAARTETEPRKAATTRALRLNLPRSPVASRKAAEQPTPTARPEAKPSDSGRDDSGRRGAPRVRPGERR